MALADETFNAATGPLDPVWTQDGTADPTLRYVDVPTTKLYGDPLYGKPRGVRVDRGLTRARIRVPLVASASGAPLVAAVGSYSAAPVVQAVYTEASGFCPTTVEVTGALAADGRTVAIDLPSAVADFPGIYTAQFRIVDGAGVERERNEVWVYVDRGLWTSEGVAGGAQNGPPTTRELQTALRDHPGANRLLGDFEFDAAELSQAVVDAVQRFAAAFPPVPLRVSTRTWSHAARRPLVDGALAFLFELAATYCRRGTLPYSAGNVTIDDLNREKPYLAAAELYRARFDQWAKMTKSKINIQAAFGSQGSNYPGYATY